MEAVPRRTAAVGLTTAAQLQPSGPLGRAAALDPAGVELIRLWRVAVPLRRPFVTSHGVENDRQATLVEVVRGSGAVGWGECPALARPTYTGEYATGAWRLLADELVPAVLAGRGGSVRGHPMARFAVECALADAALREDGASLLAALTGGERPAPVRLQRCQVVDQRGGVEETVGAAEAAFAGGAALVKVKIGGGDPADDRRVLRALRRAFPDRALAADANGSYRTRPPGELGWLDEVGLAYVEQPYEVDDLVGHAALAEGLGTPVALDESVETLGVLHAGLRLGALDVLNVKPARLGGLAAAAAAADACARRGVRCFVGGMLELGVGRAAAAALAAAFAAGADGSFAGSADGSFAGSAAGWTADGAAGWTAAGWTAAGWTAAGSTAAGSTAEATLPTDLGPSGQYVADDVTEPVVLDGEGRLVVPAGPGIGVSPRADRLAAVVVDRVELRP